MQPRQFESDLVVDTYFVVHFSGSDFQIAVLCLNFVLKAGAHAHTDMHTQMNIVYFNFVSVLLID
jgi:hypothetical protein